MTEEQPAQSNGIDTEAALGFIRRIENIQGEIDEAMDEARKYSEPLRQDIAAIKREAVDAGIGKQELGAVLKRRRLERQAASAGEHLDIEQRANFEQMIEALERTAEQMGGPLGGYARAQAEAARG